MTGVGTKSTFFILLLKFYVAKGNLSLKDLSKVTSETSIFQSLYVVKANSELKAKERIDLEYFRPFI